VRRKNARACAFTLMKRFARGGRRPRSGRRGARVARPVPRLLGRGARARLDGST